MEKEFIPYEQALALKELGFDEACFGYFYTKDKFFNTIIKNSELDEDYSISSPLYQQAFRWFREKYNLIGWICPFNNGKNESNNFLSYGFAIKDIFIGKTNFENYEEAELECLKKLIEIVKENGNKN